MSGTPNARVARPGGPRRVTSTDVARAAGVSRATVSYVLNGVGGSKISEATRALVLQKAEELGHVPFAPARSLRRGRSDIVLVLVRDFRLSWVARSMLDALDHAMANRGLIILIDRYDPALRSISELWQLVSPSLVVAMGGLTIPEVSELEGGSERFLQFQGMVPNERIGRMQGEYLVERGHARIGYALMDEPSAHIIANDRLGGFTSALSDLGKPPPFVLGVDADDAQSVRAAMDTWFAAGVTAVAAQSDDLALMITGWLSAMGLTPGKDLAVIGVDDTPAAAVGLTTVRIEVERWAVQVVDAVVALLDDRPVPDADHDIVRLMRRTSA